MTKTPVIRAHDFVVEKTVTPAEPRLLYSQKEAAHLLSISPRTVGTLISNQMIATRVIGGRRLIPRSELHRFAKSDHPHIGIVTNTVPA